ncbi:ABC transporter permease [Allopusillimonas ginsengisoli]|uniref:ABC transporter permease n=1 Tax=Allopusillimonas ginsengisoli TaxID=453575 RepID=UPI00102090DF|nr:ABC transporter permease [Allopusillimonas ginsengisoli]TEA74177.1 ABC transporter permease [Allopusillimonas ginsengisoli]
MNISTRRPSAVNLISRSADGGVAWLGYLFLIIPSLIVIPMSFSAGDELTFPPKSYSLHLYEQYFTTSTWMEATWVSFKVAIFAMLFSLIFGVLGAYGINRSSFRGRKFLAVTLLSPMFVPNIVVALALYLYFSRFGLTGTTLGLILAHIIITIPFVMVTCFAGLKQIDINVEKASAIMGAGRLYTLIHVTLPILRPSIISAGLFSFLISFDEVVISYFLSGVLTQTLPVKMYSSIHWEISPVLAAVSTLLTLISSAICLIVAVTKGISK